MERLWAAGPVASQVREKSEVERFFAGLDLVEPGIVRITEWQPGAGRRPVRRDCLLRRRGGQAVAPTRMAYVCGAASAGGPLLACACRNAKTRR